MAAEGRAAGEVPVEEEACQFPPGAQQPESLFDVIRPPCGVEGAEKSLFYNEIILTAVIEEISGDQPVL